MLIKKLKNKKTSSAKKSVKYKDWLIPQLENKKQAMSYLNAAIDDYQNHGKSEIVMLAFSHVVKAQGGIAELAKKTKLNRQTLYRTLSGKRNPGLDTILNLIQALGFRLKISAN
ncbi:MAG: putative addiction module antidote protein [Gammaproteobacteria bacterium CG_4_10_14_0_8_um_filter_38_16]|nr:MAG: putative addiction module antidote protein [Gammaproteobacteria bacterium CG_4_10_14_0_8_um_filter_38_16]PJA03319.1 MAG: putative addiction module antidote protein [Gammaproteobacteria bacterium CG_4_10_14_0_2_um_filter_38_22]PJB09632.1 MAG: putative addiction module antidote protein [Gammaproteobacteria bacterium CG_4_9_14_3_um_filter_38_9]